MRSIPVILFVSLLLASCQNTPKADQKSFTVGKLTLKKSDGPDCDKPDTLRNNCAVVDLAWPEIKDGSEPLKKAVAGWALNFLCGMLSPEIDSTTGRPASVAAAVDSFFQMHRDFVREAPESPMANFDAESTDTVLLNDGKRLTLQIDGYVYAGGAHGSPMTAVATFDNATGKKLMWADLVTDSTALKALAEKKFREVRADIFKPDVEGNSGFDFDETFPFVLPVSYGLTDKGIYFYYQHYEVTPYALGTTDFVIPFEELGALWKK